MIRSRSPVILLLLVLLTVALVKPPSALARDAHEQARIDYLIDSLGALKGAVFIRNGTEYDAQAARDHLRQKLNFVGNRVQTAEQFIKYLASESSMSHRHYQIRFADGSTTDTGPYFTARLKEFDEKNH